MIIIRLVRVGNRLVGQDFSSRWNLAQLGFSHLDMPNIRRDMAAFRRVSGGDFILDTVNTPMVGITSEERAMFGRHVARIAA